MPVASFAFLMGLGGLPHCGNSRLRFCRQFRAAPGSRSFHVASVLGEARRLHPNRGGEPRASLSATLHLDGAPSSPGTPRAVGWRDGVLPNLIGRSIVTPTEGGAHHGHPSVAQPGPVSARRRHRRRSRLRRPRDHPNWSAEASAPRPRPPSASGAPSKPANGEGVRRWIRRYIIFHGSPHPADMGAAEVMQLLSSP